MKNRRGDFMSNKGGSATEVELIVTDAKGNLIKIHKQKSETLLMNFIRFIERILLTGNPVIDALEPAASVTISDMQFNNTSAVAPANVDSWGIQIGRSSSPNGITTFQLGDKISHGTGSGQMIYNACSSEEASGTFPTMRIKISRTFTNQSGGDITVREIGLVISLVRANGIDTVKFMIARDVLTSAITVPNGANLTVNYYVKIN
ncbi:MAG: hypothetical protein QXY41_07410 [Thermoproteota archaeon]